MEVFLAHLKSVDSLEALGNILVINEFIDIFVNIPRLPLDGEIKFVIDLVPGTALIHQNLYRMVIVELTELKR